MKVLQTLIGVSGGLVVLVGVLGCDVFVQRSRSEPVYVAQPQYVEQPQYVIVREAPPPVIVERSGTSGIAASGPVRHASGPSGSRPATKSTSKAATGTCRDSGGMSVSNGNEETSSAAAVAKTDGP